MRPALLALPLLLCAASAFAEGKDWKGQDPMRQACGADVERFCAGAKNPGMCLHEHWEEISQGCRDFKENMKKQWQAKNKGDDPVRRHCGGDLERFCGGKMDGACLHQHWDEVSEGCRSFKEQAKKDWQAKQQGEGKEGGGYCSDPESEACRAYKAGQKSRWAGGEAKAGGGEEKKGLSFRWSDPKKQASEDKP